VELETTSILKMLDVPNYFERYTVVADIQPFEAELLSITDVDGLEYELADLTARDQLQIRLWIKDTQTQLCDFYSSYSDWLDDVRAEQWVDENKIDRKTGA
jgi:hypothetical protein